MSGTDFGRWFEQVSRAGGGRPGAPQAALEWLPPADIVETEAGFEVSLEICGVPREAIRVTLEEGRLTVVGERPAEVEGEACRYRERKTGRFARSFAFRAPVDAEAIQAALADGVLTLRVPKRQPMKASLR